MASRLAMAVAAAVVVAGVAGVAGVAAAEGASATETAQHPYLPKNLDLPAGYVPNTLTYADILSVFGVGVAAVVSVSLVVSRRAKLNGIDTATVVWLTSSGLIHIILEGYFAWNNRTLTTHMDFLGQLWKEYGNGDSRYVSSDTFVVPMETFTAWVEGPLCLLTAYALLNNRPWRHATQILTSFGQFYGCVLYFATEEIDPVEHNERWHPLFFWFYYVFMNGLWIVIPGSLVIQSARAITRHAAQVQDKRRR